MSTIGGAPPPEMNTCRYDDCRQDSDCSTGFVCLEKGLVATNQLIFQECTSHSDCTASQVVGVQRYMTLYLWKFDVDITYGDGSVDITMTVLMDLVAVGGASS